MDKTGARRQWPVSGARTRAHARCGGALRAAAENARRACGGRFSAPGDWPRSVHGAQRRHTVEKNTNQLGLATHTGLGENRAQMGARGVAADAEFLRHFLQRRAVDEFERQRGLARGEVEELPDRACTGQGGAARITHVEHRHRLAAIAGVLARWHHLGHHAQAELPRRTGDRHRVDQARHT